MKKKKTTKLTLELLEDRTVPSTAGSPWGIAWPNSNVTLSFVPDGTLVDGVPSTLFKTLGAQATTQAWETQILEAAQTWADAGNVNVGLVADGGEPIGCPGLIQGDPRFGDIRIAAEPLGLNAPVAIGTPYSPLAGTLSGDVIFNSSYAFGIGASSSAYDIYTVALHELGHSFGLPDNTDPTSVMYNTYQGVYTGLGASDVAAFQSLYGAPSAGPGNNTLATAAVMSLPEIAADVSAINQTDYYAYTVPWYANQTITVTVQNGGLSLLVPQLSVYTASGQLVATSTAASPFSNTTSVTLSNIRPGMTLYFEVDSARSDVFGMGSYRLSVNSGLVSALQIAAISASLNADTIAYANFNHGTSTIATAITLDQPVYQIDPNFNFAVDGQLNDAADVDYFSITTPATPPQAIVFTAAAGQCSRFSPQLTVYDANGNPVAAQVLSNDSSGYVVQIVNPVAGAKYYVAVTASPFAAAINDRGTYRLGVNYLAMPIVLETLADNTLSAADSVNLVCMQSTEVQIYAFVLSVDTGTSSGGSVVMQLFDANGNLVASLVCQDGNTVSMDVLLDQGAYTVRLIAVDSNGAPLPTSAYTLLGSTLTNPMDPITVNPTDPTLNPPTTSTTTPPPTTVVTNPTSTTTPPPTVVVTDPTVPPVLPPVNPTTLLTTLTSLL